MTQLLKTPTSQAASTVNNGTAPANTQSLLERLSSASQLLNSSSTAAISRRRSKNVLLGTAQQIKSSQTILPADFWSLTDKTSDGTIMLKAQLLEVARKLQQKEVTIN